MNRESSRLLRLALRANAAFSTLCGVALTLFPAPLADALGVPHPALLRGIGVVLLVFAVGLVRNASRVQVHRGEARLASVLDLGWVGGSVLLLALRPVELTSLGVTTVIGVAVAVLAFAAFQLAGLRRLAA